MFKKIVIMLMMVMFFCCSCTTKKEVNTSATLNKIQKRDYIIVGVKADTYPFGYKDLQGRFQGFDVELARLIAKDILGDKSKVKFIQVSSADRMIKLYSDEVDMLIATMSVTPKRKQILDFSNAYHTAGQALLVKSNSNIRKLKDLKNKKVIIVYGSTSERSIRSAIPEAHIMGCRSYKEAYYKLKSGDASAIVSDDTILLGLALKDPSLKLIPKRYTKEPYAVAFRKEGESQDLILKVNETIDIASRNGTLKNIKRTFNIK